MTHPHHFRCGRLWPCQGGPECAAEAYRGTRSPCPECWAKALARNDGKPNWSAIFPGWRRGRQDDPRRYLTQERHLGVRQ